MLVLLFDFFRLILAAVFVIAGLAKLRHPARTREDLDELGLPPRTSSVAGIALPAVEMAVAALLLIEPLATSGALCALGLLALFTAVIGVNLWRGRRPACACFGALSRSRIGPGTLARNTLLMAMAGALLLPPSAIPLVYATLPAPSALILGASALMGCAMLFLAWWVFQLWRQQGRLLLRIEQLEHREQHAGAASAQAPEPVKLPRPPEIAGRPAPALTLRDVSGRGIDLPSLRGTTTVLLFLDSTCRHCRPLLSRLHAWRPAASASTRVIVALAGPRPEVNTFAPGIMVVDSEDPGAMEAFGILGTPSAVAIGADGIVAEPAARGYAAVAKLLDRLASQEEPYELATV